MGNGSPSFQKKYMKVNHRRQEKSRRCLCTRKEEKDCKVKQSYVKELALLTDRESYQYWAGLFTRQMSDGMIQFLEKAS